MTKVDAPSGKDFSDLKQAVLNAVFNDEALPGSATPLRFPDLALLLHQPQVYLLDESFTKPVYIEKIKKPLVVLSEKSLTETAGKSDKLIYLQFSVQNEGANDVHLSLESKVLSENKRPVVLSSLQLRFRQVNHRWQVVDQPTFLSS